MVEKLEKAYISFMENLLEFWKTLLEFPKTLFKRVAEDLNRRFEIFQRYMGLVEGIVIGNKNIAICFQATAIA
jgi:hypothetical protein